MQDIEIGSVFRDLESPAPVSECFADVDNTCPLLEVCRLRLAVSDAAEAFFAHLDGITLDALVCGNDRLIDLFQPTACIEKA